MKRQTFAWLLLPLALPVVAGQPEGWAYQLFVDRELWQQHRVQVAPRVQLGVLADSEAVGLETDEGVLLNRAELLVYRPLKGRVLPGAGAKAGPMRQRWDWGFRLEGRYGSDFAPLHGVDDGREQRLKVSLPQWYLQAYAPVLDGVTLRLGNFFSSVGNENDSPNDPPRPFYSHSLAYDYGPRRHVGALFSARLPWAQQSGQWSADLGLVQGWDNLQDNNNRPTLLTGLHWQRRDGRLALDWEGLWGAEQSSEPGQLQAPFAVLSDASRPRQFQSLTLRYWNKDKRWRTDVNAFDGRQRGGEAGPVQISTDSHWYGGSLTLVRQLAPKWQLAIGYEWARDKDHVHSTLPGGIYQNGRISLSWFPEAWLRIRPELRYDAYRQAAGQPDQDNRWLLSLDATLFL